MGEPTKRETERLEALWSGEFGDQYVERNREAGRLRGPFWRQTLAEFPAQRVLEVGCNVGANIGPVCEVLGPSAVYGIDINQKAVDIVRSSFPGVNALTSFARELPFRDSWFDLTFTIGVLIHQSDETLASVMAELVRCSRRFVLCGEYYAPVPTEVPYRGQSGALFKRDYGKLYQSLFPALRLRKEGQFHKEQGFDDVTVWVFEKA